MVEERESITSKLCSFARAWHTYHAKDRIFDDYLAFDLMGKEEYESMYELIREGIDGTGSLSREDAEKVIEGRDDNLKAFENVSLISAYFAGQDSSKSKEDSDALPQMN